MLCEVNLRILRGTTLIEVLIVVVILGVVAALAVPQLFPLVRETEGRTDSEAVASFLDAAHRRALAEGRCFRVRVVASALALERRLSADCVNLGSDAWSSALERQTVAKGTVLSIEALGAMAADDRLIFRPSGRLRGDGDLEPEDDAARVVLTRTDIPRSRTVLVAPTGRICTLVHAASPPALAAPVSCP